MGGSNSTAGRTDSASTPASADVRPPRPLRGIWALGWAAVVTVAALLGRLTVEAPDAPSLVAPTAGVAVVWFLTRGVSLLSGDGALLVLCLLAVVLADQLPLSVGAALVIGMLAQVGLTLGLLRSWCPEVWGIGTGPGATEAISTARRLVRVLGATVLGGIGGGLIGMVGLLLVDDLTVGGLDLTLLIGRAVAGGLIVVPITLVVARTVATRGAPRPSDEGGAVELAALIVASCGLYLAAFLPDGLPLAFPLLLVTAWAALRFSTALAAMHSAAAGIAVVAFTLVGRGPFAVTDDPRSGAALAQLFVAVVVGASLTLGVGRDERRRLLNDVCRAETRASEQSTLLATIIDTMHEGVVVLEEDERVLLRNPAASALALDLLSTFQIVDDTGRVLESDQLPSHRALAGEDVRGRYVVRAGIDAPDVFLELTATPLPVTDGPRRAVLVMRDVTEQEQQRRELVAFAGVVAHDLKNPLTAIDGWVGLLADELEEGTPDRALVVQAVDRVQTASGRMGSLIKHLLQHATSRDAALRPEAVDVAALARDIVAGREASEFVAVGSVPTVQADPAMLRQLFENLLANGLKYVPPGEVADLTVDGERLPDDPSMVAVRVTDNGVGIPDESKELVFQQFYRAHASAYSGTGLGLAICRRIVERHGGTIAVRDNPRRRGTQIEVVLPAAATA